MISIPNNLDAVVIGAGAAGLAAARRLRAGAKSVIVVEARARIGGRAVTVQDNGHPIDLGCGWLHSADDNPWVAKAAALGFTVDPTDAGWDDQTDDLGFSRAEQKDFTAAYDAFEQRREAGSRVDADRAAADYLEPANRWNPLLDAISSYVNGVELADLSTHDTGNYADSGIDHRVSEGYGALIAAYGADVPVVLDCPVQRVDHGGEGVKLTTALGAITARVAVVAVPSNIIAREILAFRPRLPDKIEAAHALPLGLANKVFFRLRRPAALAPNGHLMGRIDTVATGSYTLRPLGGPIVMGYYGGALAAELEKGGEADFADFALGELSHLLGADIRRELEFVTATAWNADPWALGAYSYARIGACDQRATLAAPHAERLFFAGEACSIHDFSTAHGAYRTGIAAAEEAIKVLEAG